LNAIVCLSGVRRREGSATSLLTTLLVRRHSFFLLLFRLFFLFPLCLFLPSLPFSVVDTVIGLGRRGVGRVEGFAVDLVDDFSLDKTASDPFDLDLLDRRPGAGRFVPDLRINGLARLLDESTPGPRFGVRLLALEVFPNFVEQINEEAAPVVVVWVEGDLRA
jgi:hypothetical protein